MSGGEAWMPPNTREKFFIHGYQFPFGDVEKEVRALEKKLAGDNKV